MNVRSIIIVSASVLFLGQAAWAQQIIETEQAQQIARRKGWVIRQYLPEQGTTIELQKLVNGIPLYYSTDNYDAADSVSTDEVWPGGSSGLGLTGAGVQLGIWDGGGVLTTHQELVGRATQMDDPNGTLATHYHSTHVGGTMIATGVDPNSPGMSPGATLDCYEWTDDDVEMEAAAAAGLRVSNHSYGYITGWRYGDFGAGEGWYWWGDVTVDTYEDYYFGYYDATAAVWDRIAHDYPDYLIVKSAGNDRDEGPASGTEHWYWDPNAPDPNAPWAPSTDARSLDGNSGYDSVSHMNAAKNILTVGAVYDVNGGYAGPGSVGMTSFSCWGPCDDGRIKPDVVANGYSLYSCVDWGSTAYYRLSGTSMAAPNASGSVGLLIEHYRNTHAAQGDMPAATLKGLVIHTADESGSANGPDYEYGWGLLNTLTAANVISADVTEPLTISGRTLSDGQGFAMSIETDGTSSKLRATVCWTDPAGTSPDPAVDPPDKMLVNDLDLRIESEPPGTTYYPWVLDPANPSVAATTGDNDVDNMEQIVIYSPGTASYTLHVTHKGSLTDGSQDFSLVVTGASNLSVGGGGDCDGDSDVDLQDFLAFQTCYTGPGGSLSPGCECADFDGDSDVDLQDFLAFQTAYTGPGG